LIGFVFGAMFGQLNKKMALTGSEIKGGEPTPEQLAQLQKTQKLLKVITPLHVGFLIVAAVFMSIARYMVF
jgi:hypothetical protein